jgi:hypothetical protein
MKDPVNQPLLSHRVARAPRRGLTFIELMFATMILGLGIIIIASVFPVAISEQRATIDAAASNSIERSAARTLDGILSVTGVTAKPFLEDTTTAAPVRSFDYTWNNGANNINPWDCIRGDLVDKADPRYAWTAVYERLPNGGDNNRVTLFIATLASRDSASFDTSPASLDKLKPGNITITYTVVPGADPDRIVIGGADAAIACEGAFIIRSAGVDASPTNSLYPNDVILKLGNQVGANDYEVAPGFEYLGTTPIAASSAAFVVGRDRSGTGANQALSCRAITLNVPDPG